MSDTTAFWIVWWTALAGTILLCRLTDRLRARQARLTPAERRIRGLRPMSDEWRFRR